MKVSQEKVKAEFIPITITLETEEEANFMWHMLNCLESRALLDYWGEYAVGEFPTELETNMWKAFAGCYSLEEHKKSKT